MKLNLSGDGIKEFFFANGEKLVLGITVLLLCSFLYSAITAKPLDDTKSPDSLKRKSDSVVASVQQAGLKPDVEIQKSDFTKEVDKAMQPVPAAPLRASSEWNPLLFPELVKRADPVIYPVTDLQIAGGIGIVPYLSEAVVAPMGMGMAAPAAIAPAAPAIAPAPAPGAAAGSEKGTPQPLRIDGQATPPGVRAQQGEPRKKAYAIITGLVPLEKESEEYRRLFEYAVPAIPDPSKPQPQVMMQGPTLGQVELPHYFCFLVDRAEVKDGKDANLNWVSLIAPTTYTQAVSEVATWAAQAPEIVHPDYVAEPQVLRYKGQDYPTYVTWPLPGLILRNWGFEASHPPQVKFNFPQDAQEIPGQGQAPGEDTFEAGGAGAAAGGAAAAPGAAAGQTPRQATAPPAMAPAPMIAQRGAFDHDHDHGPAVMPGRGGVQMAPFAMGTPGAPANVSYKLFRFVDLTAEPGKTYRYRFQLLVNNPNFGLKQDCLDPKAIQEKSADKRFRMSAWSDPTPAVTVPQDFRLLSDSVSGGTRGAEPKAKINLLAIVKTAAATDAAFGSALAGKDIWLEAMKEFEWPLGSIPDLHEQSFENVTDLTAGVVRKIEKVGIDAGQTVLLDVRNDDPLGAAPGRSKTPPGPTEILYMDSSGRLLAASSAADGLIAKDYKDRTTVPTEQSAAPPIDYGKASKGIKSTPPAPKGPPAPTARGGG